jgi:hypothetical protein
MPIDFDCSLQHPAAFKGATPLSYHDEFKAADLEAEQGLFVRRAGYDVASLCPQNCGKIAEIVNVVLNHERPNPRPVLSLMGKLLIPDLRAHLPPPSLAAR